MDTSARHVVGIDFGTLSGRAVVVRVSDGAELASSVHDYENAVVDSVLPGTGERLPPEWALQVPSDYITVLRTAVPQAVAAAGIDPSSVIGVGIDFTASTLIPVTEDGTPLCELDEFRDRKHAYVSLWKHHAAQAHAHRITALATSRREPWLARYGGLISSEWQLSKGLQLFEEARDVYDAMWRHVEAADWMVWQLGGRYAKNASIAGYKGNFQDGAYPDADFLNALAPGFDSYVSDKLAGDIVQLGALAGHLTERAAAWTGLPVGIPVAAGNVDAHVSNPAAMAVEPGQLVAIMGTSSCLIISDSELHEVPGMCGVVDGGVIAGCTATRPGSPGSATSSRGSRRTASRRRTTRQPRPPGRTSTRTCPGSRRSRRSARTVSSRSTGGRATVPSSSTTSCPGSSSGSTCRRKPEDIYRALLESTAFGARVIVQAYVDAGVPVNEFIVVGGLRKNPLLDADLLGRAAPAVVAGHLRARVGARRGHPCRRRGGRLP